MATLSQICINGDCSEEPNGFSRIRVDGMQIDADSPSDTLNINAGTNITLTPDVGTDTMEISAPDVYNKTETYTKAEVDALIQGGGSGLIYVQDVSPTGGVKANDVATNVASGNYAFASGAGNSASGTASHVEGENNTASGDGSHAEGWATVASNDAAHAEGTSTTASGIYSHAEGESNTASGKGSHVEGYNNDARGEYQHVGGKYAEYDNNNTYAMMIGNGTSSSNRKNAFALDWNGNATFDGRVDADNVGIHYITSGTHNLNNYKSEGMWYFSTGTTLSNQPNSAVNGWLQVLPDRASGAASVKQIWYRHGSNPTTFKDEYVRLFASGSWGSWEKITTESDIANFITSTVTNSENTTTNRRSVKLSDGTLICAIKYTTTLAVQNTWGAIYYGTFDMSNITWPAAFAVAPSATATVVAGNDAWISMRNHSATNLGTVYLYRPVSTAAASYMFSIIAIGRWQ